MQILPELQFCSVDSERNVKARSLKELRGLDLIKLEEAHEEVHSYLFSRFTFMERRRYAAHLRASVAETGCRKISKT